MLFYAFNLLMAFDRLLLKGLLTYLLTYLLIYFQLKNRKCCISACSCRCCVISRNEKKGWNNLNGSRRGLYHLSTQTQITTFYRIAVLSHFYSRFSFVYQSAIVYLRKICGKHEAGRY